MAHKGDESAPPPDLKRQTREVLQNFSAGGKLSEEFLTEYRLLRDQVRALEAENQRLRNQLETDDALARLLAKVERLEEERRELLTRTAQAEEAQGQFDARFQEVEEQFSSLANLFVASNQLHQQMVPRSVIRRIKEILAQLVGAQAYTVYLLDAPSETLVPIASEGVVGEFLESTELDSVVGRYLKKVELYVTENHLSSEPNFDSPLVVVPLVLESRPVGAIAIFATLEQKSEFSRTDIELFKLLIEHAPSALMTAALFEQAQRKLPGIDSFRDLSI
ncbi:MAG: GAF domain-containing protein [Polyangiaceae bacterium]|nr:GAF domain-containing protein [Polyangiaceae bacterium]